MNIHLRKFSYDFFTQNIMRNGFFDVTLQVINKRKDNISTNPQKNNYDYEKVCLRRLRMGV